MANTAMGRVRADIAVSGCHQTRPPETSAPEATAVPSTTPCRASAASTSAPGSLRWTVSTYQSSSGPESKARKVPIRQAPTANIQKVSASR